MSILSPDVCPEQAPPARDPATPLTLDQVLRQACMMQGLILQQMVARVYREDSQPISPQYLHRLKQDRQRPSLPLAQQLASVLALDHLVLLTQAHLANTLLRRYLPARLDREMTLIEMLWTAEQRGLGNWKRVTRQIVAPDLSSTAQRRTDIRQTHTRRPHDVSTPRRTPKRADY